MRTRTIQGDGLTITLRGKTRRQPAIETEYLVNLKKAHPEMRAADPGQGKTVDELTSANPRAWSLLGVANGFRVLAARCQSVAFATGETYSEPFTPEQLVLIFDQYLSVEQMPDQSDVWSQAETVLKELDKPPEPTDPNAGSDAPKP